MTRILFLLLVSSLAHAQNSQIDSFFPTGSVKKVQQVTVRFSTDMIAMGDPRSKDDPFTVVCTSKDKSETKFTTRWADNKNWSLDFEKPLKAGVRCSFKIKPESKDLRGNKVLGLEEYSFSTSGPALLGVAPIYGEIEPEQYFVALLDGAIDIKSLEKNAYFEVEDVPEKVGANVVNDSNREAILRAAIKNNWRWDSYRKILDQKPAKKFSQIQEMENFVIISANRRFPEDAKVVFHWPKGILSKSGLPVEEAQKFDFRVISAFEARFSCERTTPERPCNPILDMNVSLSRAVPAKMLKGAKLVAKDGKTWMPLDAKEEEVSSLTFKAPFPDSTEFKVILPNNIRDEIGRKLSNQDKFPLTISTDEYSPLIKFPATFGILESKGDPILPVTVRNIEDQLSLQQVSVEGRTLSISKAPEIISWYRRVIAKDYNYSARHSPILNEGEGKKFQMPKPLGKREFEVVGIPLRKSGFYVVEMMSPKLGQTLLGSHQMYVATAALVTDMAVHIKKGRESSLVWVTRLSDSRPVSGAKVSIFTKHGDEIGKGTTTSNGTLKIAEISPDCTSRNDYDYGCEFYVFAQKDEDLTFTSSEWSKGIESYRFDVTNEYLSGQWGPITLHSVLDRMVAQPGDSIQMKHIVREYRSQGFSMVNQTYLPKRVLIVHQESKKTFTLPFDFDKSSGSAIGKFEIPKNATLGRYTIYLSNKTALPAKEQENEEDPFDWSARETGHFVVSEYRLPLMKANVKIQGQPLVRPTEVKTDLSASFLSGGPARGLKVKLRTSMQPGSFTPDIPGASSFSFFAEPTKPGVINNDQTQQSADDSFLKVQELTLDQEGGKLATFSGVPNVTKLQELSIEMEYTDPNGEFKTTSSRVPVFPGEYIVGLRTEDWYTEPGKTKIQGVITNINGKAVKNRAYTVEAFKTNYITHRKRLVGGFYAYDSRTEVVALGKVCDGKSDDLGRFVCEPKKLPAGSITLQAKTTDEKKRSTYAATSISVYDVGSQNWWVPSDSDRIDLIPEKTKFEPGEDAKIIVRSPFEIATALVTIEREGILDSFVKEIRRDNPVLNVPLKGYYAPNVFVSVLLIRGRVDSPKATSILDLARPSMKMGLIDLKVGWKSHELLVSLKSDKNRYRAREKAQVTINVKNAAGTKLSPDSEVIVAAVDESLLRLKDNSSWKILRAMMGQRGLAVSTSSGQNQVIGRRHYGAKAKPPGGGGGTMTGDVRELFEPVIFWQPKIKLSSDGEAKVTIPLNDSITSFRIVAIATSGTDFFGDGQVNVESTKDLIIYSGFAPLVREGDSIQNAFTLRNTTTNAMKVNVTLNSKELPSLPAIKTVELKPSEATTIRVPVTIPTNVKEISYTLKARDSVSGSEDAMIIKVRVEPAVPNRVLQATLFQLEQPKSIPVKQPSDALPGKGGLGVHARATLVSGLAGVKSYMEDYGYTCLEQQVSKSISLERKDEVERIIKALPTYFDPMGLLKFFPSSICGSAQLTRYVMNITAEGNFQIPNETKDKVLSGLKSYVNGQYSCRSWWDDFVRDQYSNEAKLLVMETLARYKEFSPSMLTTIQITPNVWKTETVVAWFQLLKMQPDIPNQKTLIVQAEQILRSRMNFQGSIMTLQGQLDWEAQWRLFTSPDQEAMTVFNVSIDENAWAQDTGRIARGIVARLKQGHFDTTMSNAWAMTYFRKFSKKFEKDKVEGETKVVAGSEAGTFNWKKTPNGESQLLKWPALSDKKEVAVEFKHSGSGKPWIHFETISAIPLKAPFDMGYRIVRKITPVSQKTVGEWHTGDVVNVELTITAKYDQPWVVVRDPIPAGSSHLGTGLDGSSDILNKTPKKNMAAGEISDWPTEYEEKSMSNFISYAAYLPKGIYRLNYRLRLNSSGDFKLPQSRVEAMYSPETFGEVPNAVWKVAQ